MKVTVCLYTLILLTSLVSSPVFTQQLNDAETAAYRNVLSLTRLQHEKKISPPFLAYLKVYESCLNALMNGTLEAQENFEAATESAKRILPESDDLLIRFLQNEIQTQVAFVSLKYGQELAAAWQLKKVYQAAKTNIDDHPDFIPFQKSWGLMQVLVGAIPDNYQWVPKLFGVSGSINDGKKLLAGIPPSHWLYPEAQAILQLTRSYLLEESERAAIEFGNLIKKEGDNPLYTYLYLTLLMRNHQAPQAVAHFEKSPEPLPLSYYLVGNALLQAGKYDGAIEHFRQFETTFDGTDFRKDAAYKRFLAGYLEGSANMKLLEEIPNIGEIHTESDRYAQKMAKKGDLPDPGILKIRLATDGGFYKEAGELVASLDESSFENPEDQIEFVYRKARLMHFTDAPEAAIQAYLQTIEMQGNQNYYYAPNACLQLGYLYLQKGEKDLSREYFQKTFNYRSYDYRKGIERKAHSALVTYFQG